MIRKSSPFRPALESLETRDLMMVIVKPRGNPSPSVASEVDLTTAAAVWLQPPDTNSGVPITLTDAYRIDLNASPVPSAGRSSPTDTYES